MIIFRKLTENEAALQANAAFERQLDLFFLRSPLYTFTLFAFLCVCVCVWFLFSVAYTGFLFLFNLSHLDLSPVESQVRPYKDMLGRGECDSRIFDNRRGDSLRWFSTHTSAFFYSPLSLPCLAFCFSSFSMHRHACLLQTFLLWVFPHGSLSRGWLICGSVTLCGWWWRQNVTPVK